MKGTLADGVNSTKRFMNKNFKDEDKQISMDLFLGRFEIERKRYEDLFCFDSATSTYFAASTCYFSTSLSTFCSLSRILVANSFTPLIIYRQGRATLY